MKTAPNVESILKEGGAGGEVAISYDRRTQSTNGRGKELVEEKATEEKRWTSLRWKNECEWWCGENADRNSPARRMECIPKKLFVDPSTRSHCVYPLLVGKATVNPVPHEIRSRDQNPDKCQPDTNDGDTIT